MGHSLGVDFNARRTRRIGDTCVAAVEQSLLHVSIIRTVVHVGAF